MYTSHLSYACGLCGKGHCRQSATGDLGERLRSNKLYVHCVSFSMTETNGLKRSTVCGGREERERRSDNQPTKPPPV